MVVLCLDKAQVLRCGTEGLSLVRGWGLDTSGPLPAFLKTHFAHLRRMGMQAHTQVMVRPKGESIVTWLGAWPSQFLPMPLGKLT